MSGAWTEAQVALAAAAALLLFLLQAAFSLVLIAVSALNRVALHRLSSESAGRLGFLEGMREPLSTHRAATHLARQLCLLGGALLVVLAARGSGWSYPAVVGIAAAALSVLLLELVVARSVALWDPRAVLRRTAVLVRPAHALFYPLVHPVHSLLAGLGRTVGEQQREDEQEVEALIEVGEREGILEADEGQMMRSIVDLDETAVREIMTPRPDIVALPLETTVEQARRTFLSAGHSRLPVYRESVDDIVGVLHVRDLLRADEQGNEDQPISAYLRDAMFVPESRSVADVLSEMRLTSQMALVVDEYGGTAGLVTVEDLVEEIVGEIRDEHEEEEAEVREQADGSWIISAAAHVDTLEELFGIELGERDFDTVGGLVVAELGRVPATGDTLTFRSLLIDVLQVDGRRIRQVRIRPRRPSERARAEL